jgi:hypothetical protein
MMYFYAAPVMQNLSAVASVERSIPSAKDAISFPVNPDACPVAVSTASSRR